MITQTELKSLVEYEPQTGLFRTLHARGPLSAGSVTGARSQRGYLRLNIKYRSYLCHRLAWLYVHGDWPKGVIDHINGITDDNRISNLRDVSISINTQNQRTASKNNKSGYLGVSSLRGKYRASITCPGDAVTTYLGTYATPEEAHAVYMQAKEKFHPGATVFTDAERLERLWPESALYHQPKEK